MIKPIVNGNTVTFGPCRLSYTYLLEKYTPKDGAGEPKYMTNVLIPKSERETIKAIQKAIEAAKDSGVHGKWNGKEPRKLDIALRDGDDREKDVEAYADHMYLNAKSGSRPCVLARDGKTPLTDEEEVYSGMWALVSVSFFPYLVSGNAGVGCGLEGVRKYKDDDKLGGGSNAAATLGGIDLDDCDDDDLGV